MNWRYKILLVFVGIVFLLPLLLYFSLQLGAIQNYLVRQLTQQLSRQYETVITLERVDIRLFNQLVAEGVYIQDKKNDTLLYTEELGVYIEQIRPFRREVNIDRIRLQNPHIAIDTDSIKSNYDFLIPPADTLSGPDTAASWAVTCQHVTISGGQVSYQSHPMDTASGFNPDDIALQGLELDIEGLSLVDTLSFQLNKLAFREKSGLTLKHLSTQAEVAGPDISLRNFDLRSEQSQLAAHHLAFGLPPDSGSWEQSPFYAQVLPQTQLAPAEFSDFLPGDFQDETFSFSGIISGTPADLSINDFSFKFRPLTQFQAQARISGLPHTDSLDYNINIQKASFKMGDISHLLGIFGQAAALSPVSPYLGPQEIIGIEAHAEGNMSKTKLRAQVKTSSGKIQLQTTARNLDRPRFLQADAEIGSEGFDFGRLLNMQDMLGSMQFAIQINNFRQTGPIPTAEIKAGLKEIELMDNTYDDLFMELHTSSREIRSDIRLEDEYAILSLDMRNFFGEDKAKSTQARLTVNYLDLKGLGIDSAASNSELSFGLSADIYGTQPSNASGKVKMFSALIDRNDHRTMLDSLRLDIEQNETSPSHFRLASDYLDAQVSGILTEGLFPYLLQNTIYTYLPAAQADSEANANMPLARGGYMEASMQLKDVNPLLGLFSDGLILEPGGKANINWQAETNKLTADMHFPAAEQPGYRLDSLTLNIDGQDNVLKAALDAKQIILADQFYFKNVKLHNHVSQDSIHTQLNWNSKEANNLTYSGDMGLDLHFKKALNVADLHIKPSEITIGDTVWTVAESFIKLDSSSLELSRLLIHHNGQKLAISGTAGPHPEDTLRLKIEKFNLIHLNQLFVEAPLTLGGEMFADWEIRQALGNAYINAKDSIHNIAVNGQALGILRLDARYSTQSGKANLYSTLRDGTRNRLYLNADYNIAQDQMDGELQMEYLSMRPFQPFFEDFMQFNDGYLSSQGITISGPVASPNLNGTIDLQRFNFNIGYLNTPQSLQGQVHISPDQFQLDSLKLTSRRGSKAIINGTIGHTLFNDYVFDIKGDLNNFYLLNTEPGMNEDFYGSAYIDGFFDLEGPMSLLNFDASLSTRENTKLFVPLSSGGKISNYSYIVFAGDTIEQAQEIQVEEKGETEISGISVNLDLSVTPDAELQIILDEGTGDALRTRGRGNLRMVVKPSGDFNMYGDYELTEGDYQFTLQNVLKKRFEIAPGSTISWDGAPDNANMDIRTLYTIKNTSLYDLTLQDKYKDMRVPVQCEIALQENLAAPVIGFDVSIPEQNSAASSVKSVREQLNNLPQEEINKQFLSLLIINRFQPLPGFSNSRTALQASSSGGLANNASEMLTNQLSSWLSQISEDVNVGINYNQSDSLSTSELELALSTQLINDRLMINGNISMGDEYSTMENYVGDIDVEYQLTKNGKLRVRYYNRISNDFSYDEAPNKQGIGLFYQEEFDHFGDLARQYWESITQAWGKLFGKDDKTKK